MGVRLIGVANKTPHLEYSWALPNDSKHNEAGFSMVSTDLLCLRVAQVPRSRDLAIFVLMTDRQQIDRQTDKPIALPLLRMCAHGVTNTKTGMFLHVMNIFSSSQKRNPSLPVEKREENLNCHPQLVYAASPKLYSYHLLLLHSRSRTTHSWYR
jgi:hypothetical protein